MESDQKTKLNRFTCLRELFDILANKRITLKDPKRWDDTNDTHCLEQFKKAKGFKSVLALCFCAKGETIHHWDRFSKAADGVCIEFDKQKIVDCLETCPEKTELLKGEMIYREIKEVVSRKVEDWPFLKRIVYTDESEFRIVYCGHKECEKMYVPIRLDCIRKINLSPNLPTELFQAVKGEIQKLAGNPILKILPSTVMDNKQWKEKFKG